MLLRSEVGPRGRGASPQARFSVLAGWLVWGPALMELLQRRTAWGIAVVLASLSGCQPVALPKSGPSPSSSESNRAGKLTVFASNAFLAEVVTRLGGEHVELLFLAPPSEDPALWKPSPTALERLQNARLLVLNGASYEPWVAGVALPSSRMLRTANRFRENWIETEGVVHSHGPGGEHSHAGIASTTWLDFEQARLQADEVRNRLIQVLPAQAQDIESRYIELSRELQLLDREMQELAKAIGSQPLITSHPVYQYWSRRYGLNVRTVHWEPGVAPGEAGLNELDKLRNEFPAKQFLWEAPPSAENQELLRERGMNSVVFAPCANRSEQGSWLETMQTNLRDLRRAIE